MNNLAVITFADEAGDYAGKARRLLNSLPSEVDKYYFNDAKRLGVDRHKQDPYAFKVGAIDYAHNRLGYNKIAWCDSPLVYQDNLPHLETLLHLTGFVCYENIGYSVADFTNDPTLEYYQLTRGEAKDIPMVMACFFAFDLSKTLAKSIIDDYRKAQQAGMFKGNWVNHRHDQSCLSIILHNHEFEPLAPFTQDSVFCYQQHIERGFASKRNKVFIST